VLPFPFHFLDSKTMNVRPKNYTWPEFYNHVIELEKHTFSPKAIANRLMANNGAVPRWLNFVRGISTEGLGRIRFHQEVLHRLLTDIEVRKYFEQETTVLPRYYRDQIRKDLGALSSWLPESSFDHDPHAYLHAMEKVSLPGKTIEMTPVPVTHNLMINRRQALASM
jgi:hypothetical protein